MGSEDRFVWEEGDVTIVPAGGRSGRASLHRDVQEYTNQLGHGHVQRAYRGLMAFMSDLRARLERQYPAYSASVLYPGYMDMTYFAFTPPALKKAKLKLAIVYLHAEGRFELWLAGNNRQVQAEYVELLRHKDIGSYHLSLPGPGVDAIIVSLIIERPDFDSPDELKRQIELKTIGFAADMALILG